MILYKYYPCNEYTFRALSEMGLWCSPASNMNDPFDCLEPVLINFNERYLELLNYKLTKDIKEKEFLKGFLNSDEILDNVIRNLEKTESVKFDKAELIDIVLGSTSPEHHIKNAQNMIEEHRNITIKNKCFCSLTEDGKNNLMWSHYAHSHQGIVIGVELDDRYIKNKICLHQIKYTSTLPFFKIDEYMKAYTVNETSSMTSIMLDYMSHKTNDWAYEKEWRFWTQSEPHYLYYSKDELKSVYFGLRCSKETKTLVKSILRGHGVSDDVYQDIKIETDPEIRLII